MKDLLSVQFVKENFLPMVVWTNILEKNIQVFLLFFLGLVHPFIFIHSSYTKDTEKVVKQEFSEFIEEPDIGVDEEDIDNKNFAGIGDIKPEPIDSSIYVEWALNKRKKVLNQYIHSIHENGTLRQIYIFIINV